MSSHRQGPLRNAHCLINLSGTSLGLHPSTWSTILFPSGPLWLLLLRHWWLRSLELFLSFLTPGPGLCSSDSGPCKNLAILWSSPSNLPYRTTYFTVYPQGYQKLFDSCKARDNALIYISTYIISQWTYWLTSETFPGTNRRDSRVKDVPSMAPWPLTRQSQSRSACFLLPQSDWGPAL